MIETIPAPWLSLGANEQRVPVHRMSDLGLDLAACVERVRQRDEDAARLLYREFNRDRRIRDFQIACSHLESLHSHDAVSVICKGVKGGFTADFMDFGSLLC